MPQGAVELAWVLVAVGAIVLVLGACAAVFWSPRRDNWWMWVFGMLSLGVGVFGPGFMDPYGKFLKQLVDSPSPTTYAAFLDQVGQGKIGGRERELGLSFILERPLPGVEGLLDQAVAKARNPEGARALATMRDTVRGKQAAAETLAEGLQRSNRLNPATIERFDDATRHFIVQPMLARPGPIPRQELERLAAPRPRP